MYQNFLYLEDDESVESDESNDSNYDEITDKRKRSSENLTLHLSESDSQPCGSLLKVETRRTSTPYSSLMSYISSDEVRK